MKVPVDGVAAGSDNSITELEFAVELFLGVLHALTVTIPRIAIVDSIIPFFGSCYYTLIVWIRLTGTLCKHHRLWLFVDLVGMGKECHAGKECGNPLHYLFSLSMFS